LCFLHTAPAEQTDAPLLALLTLARHEQLARRTLLQVLLPALKTQAQRMVYPVYLRDEVWEVLLCVAWETICRYPLERRHVGVATKLVLDVLHDSSRELRRQAVGHGQSEQPAELGWLLEAGPTNHQGADAYKDAAWAVAPTEPLPPEAVLLEAITAGALGRSEAELILLSRVDGIRLRLLARTLDVSYHALRQRRQRAEKRLRAYLATNRDVSKQAASTLVSYAGTVTPPDRPIVKCTAVEVRAQRAAA
jgi:DNA-directed RNA polymerase specialized sigma24 family protein